MARDRTRTEKLALTMLARHGIATVWQLHLVAARAYRKGDKAAAAIIEIADAAEREWLREIRAGSRPRSPARPLRRNGTTEGYSRPVQKAFDPFPVVSAGLYPNNRLNDRQPNGRAGFRERAWLVDDLVSDGF